MSPSTRLFLQPMESRLRREVLIGNLTLKEKYKVSSSPYINFIIGGSVTLP